MHSKVVSSSLAGLPTTAEDRRYDGDQSKCAWHHFEEVRTFQQARMRA